MIGRSLARGGTRYEGLVGGGIGDVVGAKEIVHVLGMEHRILQGRLRSRGWPTETEGERISGRCCADYTYQ